MKKIIFIVVQIFICSITFAQSPPEAINYQAVARNLSGVPLVNQTIAVEYSILQGSPSGAVVYSETHAETTNQFGLFTSEVGMGTVISGNFSAINWGSSTFYLQVKVNGDVMPATQLLSVPYALHAKTATSGVPGHNSLINSTPEPAGANCPNGGYYIQSWLDLDDDGALSTGETPISYYICNGEDGLAGADGVGIASTVDNGDGTFTITYTDATTFTTTDLTGPAGASGTTYFAGNGISLSNDTITNLGDADNDSSNELITLTNLNGNIIEITESGTLHSIDLTSVLGASYTQGAGISIVGNTISATDTSITNELQILSLNTAQDSLFISDGNGIQLPTAAADDWGNDTVNVAGGNIIGSGTVSNPLMVIDNDTSSINEFQDLSVNATNGNEINITNGTGFFLSQIPPTATNQVLTWNGSNWVAQNPGTGADNWGTQKVEVDSLTIFGDGTAAQPLSGFDGDYNSLSNQPTIPTNTSDLTNDSGFITSEVDGDITNELQTLSASGGTSPQIDLSNGGGNVTIQGAGGTTVSQAGNAITINSATGTTYTAGAGIDITTGTISNTSPDQVVNITGGGATSIAGTYPNFTISSIDNVNDADFDPNNEIQTLSFADPNLTLSNGGGTIDLSSLSSTTYWSPNATDIFSNNTGNVGIGTNSPQSKLDVVGTTNILSNTDPLIVRSSVDGFAFRVKESDNGFDAVSIYGYGTRGRMTMNSNGTTTINLDADPSISSFINAGNFGIGTNSPQSKFHVATNDVIMSSFMGSNNFGSVIMVGNSTPNMSGMLMKSSSDTAFIGFSAINQQLTIETLNSTTGRIRIETPDLISLRADTIYTEGGGGSPTYNFNSGTFLTDSLYVYGAGANTSGNVLTSNGNGKAEWKPVGSSSLWTDAGSIAYLTSLTDNVAIGVTSNLNSKFRVENSTENTTGLFNNTTNTTAFSSAIEANNSANGSGDKYAIDASTNGSGSTNNTAVRGIAQNGSVSNFGVSALAYASGTSNGTATYSSVGGNGSGVTYGVYGQNSSAATGAAYAGYFKNTNDNSTFIHGVRSEVSSSSASTQYGVSSYMNTASTGNKYGFYSLVVGGAKNWAAYFAAGDVYVNDNVGIGTLSSSSKLDVNGSIRNNDSIASYGSSTNWGYLKHRALTLSNNTSNNAAGTLFGGRNASSQNYIQLAGIDNGGNTPLGLVVAESGFVGVRTTDPTQPLDVDGRIRMRQGAIAGYVPVSDINGVMTWTDPTTIGGSSFWTSTNSGSIHPTTLTDKVGIGTDDPQEALHLKGIDMDIDVESNTSTGNSSSLHIKRSGGTPSAPTIMPTGQHFGNISYLGYDGSDYESSVVIEGSLDGNPATDNMPGKIVFHTRPTGVGASVIERMRIDNQGEVGIGISSNMSGKLHVSSNVATWSTTNSAVYGDVYGSIQSSRGVAGVSNATGLYGIGVYGYSQGAATNNYGVYGFATGGTNNYAGYFGAGDVYIQNNLGIGALPPSAKLHLDGTLRLENLGGSVPIAGSVLTSIDALGNAEWVAAPLSPSKFGYLNSVYPTNNTNSYSYTPVVLTVTPSQSGILNLSAEFGYNFSASLSSMIEVGLYVTTSAVAPNSTTAFTSVGKTIGYANPIGSAFGTMPISILYSMNVVAGNTYYIYVGALDTGNSAQTGANLTSPRINATLNSSGGL